MKKTLLVCPWSNFGDNLNKIIFQKIFRMDFNITSKYCEADIIAIGTLLDLYLYSGGKYCGGGGN